MKKMFIILVVIMMMVLGACSKPLEILPTESRIPIDEFTFEGHKFGDSMEQVIETKGKQPREIPEKDDFYTIGFGREEKYGQEAAMRFEFTNHKLSVITILAPEISDTMSVKALNKSLIEQMAEFGEPYMVQTFEGSKAIRTVWVHEGFLIQLNVDKTIYYLRISVNE